MTHSPIACEATGIRGTAQLRPGRSGATRCLIERKRRCNTPPRWPETVEAVKHILEVYAKNARKYERLGEWAERIGWEKFFELTEIPFSIKSIDDYRLAYDTWRTTTQFKFTSHIK